MDSIRRRIPSLLKCVYFTILSLCLLSVIGWIYFSDAFQTEKYIVKGKLPSRTKRDVEILAECDMECKDEKDIDDYDVLLEYDYEDEEQSGSSAKSCVRTCKIVSVNKTSQSGSSTAIPVEEVTEKNTEASLSTSKAEDGTPTTQGKEEMHSTTQPVTTSSSTSKPTKEVEDSTPTEETTTDSGKSNFEMVISGNETQEDNETTSNFLPGGLEVQIETPPVDTPENFSEHSIDSKDETPTEELSVRLVPKVIRLSVLETELEDIRLLKPSDKPPLVYLPEYNSLLSLLNGSMSKILSEISAVKNLTKTNTAPDAEVQNSSNLFSDDKISTYEDRPALEDSPLANFKSLLQTPAEEATTPNYPETIKSSVNHSSILFTTSNSVEISTNTAATIVTSLNEYLKPNISTQYVELRSTIPTTHVQSTEEDYDLSTSTQNLGDYTEYANSTVTVSDVTEETNISTFGLNEASITIEPPVLENDKDELKSFGNISTTFLPLLYNLSYSSFDASETTTLPTNFRTGISNSTMNQNERVDSETSMENNTFSDNTSVKPSEISMENNTFSDNTSVNASEISMENNTFSDNTSVNASKTYSPQQD
ncbi:serine-rich adhesin for platelets-like [Homalodisca vitripennis]|uniref:serine-rich adhesin for platelets-like n=1 Tax=Homalodisca vitripennis TaxID=197043 RepID=UPI001EEA5E77|nr:serine-rich adhesin for platelets-like [Homalodisca vitripennis]